MAEPFLGEIRLMSFNFAPKGWALCNGQLLPINQNQALFALLGTNYGGDGRVNFGLPDLRGRIPFHVGNGLTIGERGGQQAVTLTAQQIPHSHVSDLQPRASTEAGTDASPADKVWAVSGRERLYATTRSGSVSMASGLGEGTASVLGGYQAHLNLPPFLTLSFCIALQGIFPSQT